MQKLYFTVLIRGLRGPPAFAGVPPPRQDFEPCAYIVGSAASIDSTLALITGPKGFPV